MTVPGPEHQVPPHPGAIHRVVAAHGRRGHVECDGRLLAFIVEGRDLRVVCGDFVVAEERAGSQALLVTAIAPRTNVLERLHQRGRRRDVVASNLTQLVAVCAPRPSPDLALLDRYLCAAEALGCRPAVLWNKADLGLPPDGLLDDYRRLGYPVLAASSRDRLGFDQLSALLRDQTSMLVGQSGVGKSSLVNALLSRDAAAVGALSGRAGLGKHTTTAVCMYRVGGSGWLIDAPGVRDFVPAPGGSGPVDRGFPDIRRLARYCRFADCRHVHEPGCRVRDGLTTGDLSGRRYRSYLYLLETSEAAPRRRGN